MQKVYSIYEPNKAWCYHANCGLEKNEETSTTIFFVLLYVCLSFFFFFKNQEEDEEKNPFDVHYSTKINILLKVLKNILSDNHLVLGDIHSIPKNG